MVRVSILTAIFLVLLRLAIGWHFFFEGYHKIHTTYVGVTDTNRPFSSEGFFREAEGPLGPQMRAILGEPDAEALARLDVQPPAKGEEKDKAKYADRMPPALDREWNDYFKRFVDYYKLDEATRERADKVFRAAKQEVVGFLLEGKKDVKKKSPTGTADVEVTKTTPERVADYRHNLDTIRDIYRNELPALGKDVEKTHLRALKQEAAAQRAELMKDLDGYTERMKNALADLIRDRTAGFNPRLWDAADIDDEFLRMLEPKENNLPVGQEELGMPAVLGQQWDNYVAYVKQFGPSMTPQQQTEADDKLTRAKRHYVRWLTGKNEYTGDPEPDSRVPARVKEYRAAADHYRKLQKQWASQSWFFVPPRPRALDDASREVAALRAAFESDIQRHTDTLKNLVGGSLSADQVRGYAPPEKKESRQEQLDWLTRWGLTVIGAMLLAGLFTRTACLAAAGFLVMTYLNHPAYPWLPTPPTNEGNYLFVNKNVVELLALLALATTASGKWLGLDALVSRFCCGGRRSRA